MDKAIISIRSYDHDLSLKLPALVLDGVAIHRRPNAGGETVGEVSFNVTHIGTGASFVRGLGWHGARRVQAALAAEGWGRRTLVQILMLSDWRDQIRVVIDDALWNYNPTTTRPQAAPSEEAQDVE